MDIEDVRTTIAALSRACRLRSRTIFFLVCAAVVLILLYRFCISAPSQFPNELYINVSKGETLSSLVENLSTRGALRSPPTFSFFVRLWGGKTPLIAGEYYFAEPENAFLMARRFTRGDFRVTPVRITFTEGMSSADMARLLEKNLIDFDAEGFLTMARQKEGYLFPDTYFFTPGEDPASVILLLETNFTQKMASSSLQQAIVSFGKPLGDVITMASLIEKEVSDPTARRIVAGILWKRLSIGMPLQVDAVFPYIIGVYSLQLTSADLKTDSPYNTYTHKGLPPGPISNPGLDTILATVTPIRTSYLYYLSDSKGKLHYSSTYEGHLANKRIYLGN